MRKNPLILFMIVVTVITAGLGYEVQAMGPKPPFDPADPCPTPVPESSSLILLVSGLAGLVGLVVVRRRKRRK